MSQDGAFVEHYTKYLPIYRKLATVNQGNTVWIPTDAHDGWYVSSRVTNESEHQDAWDDGYPHKSRPSILPTDLDPDVERTAYTTISYAPESSYQTKYYKIVDGEGIQWMDGSSQRLPDYGDIVAWALFVDIDIDKDYKVRPLPENHKRIIEQRLDLWVKAFSSMAGSEQSVQLLDSGGGVYVFVPPTALSPVAEKYDREETQLIFNEIGTRMRTVTGKLDELICREDNYPQELFSADKVQNKNRQYKTVGSIHKTLDAVVNPIDTDDIRIEHVRRQDVTDRTLSNAESWVDTFTSDTHRSAVGSVIKYLFQGSFTEREDIELEKVDGGTWEQILDTWIDQKKDSIRAYEDARKQRENIDDQRLRTELTQDRDVAKEALNRLNNRKLKSYIINYVGQAQTYEKGGDEMDFFPFWRSGQTESGRSAFYDFYEGKARFTDKADGTSRSIVYWVALEMDDNDEQYPDADMIGHPGEDLSGAQYRKAIDELRNRGEDIPFLVPDEAEMTEQDVIRAGKELGTLTDEDVQERQNSSYKQKVVNPEAWNKTLERLDAEDIEHSFESRDPYEAEVLNETKKRIDIPFGYADVPGIESRDHGKKLLSEKPSKSVLFYTEEEIGDGKPETAMIGVVSERTDGILTIYRLMPITLGLDHVDSISDIPELDEPKELQESKMTILLPQEI